MHYTTCVHLHAASMPDFSLLSCILCVRRAYHDVIKYSNIKRMFCTTKGRQTSIISHCSLHLIFPLFLISILSCSGDGIAATERPLPQTRLATRAGDWACETYSVQTIGWIRLVSIHSYHVRLFCAAHAATTVSHWPKLLTSRKIHEWLPMLLISSTSRCCD